jgi:hypothetical protein
MNRTEDVCDDVDEDVGNRWFLRAGGYSTCKLEQRKLLHLDVCYRARFPRFCVYCCGFST